jgi:hypothetical protein
MPLFLLNGLRGNSRLKSLNPGFVSNQELLAIAGALQENKGLVDLDLRLHYRMNDERWGAICDSLKAHPTIEVLDLRASYADAATAPAVLKSRMQALLDTVKTNMSIHTIYLDSRYRQHELFLGSVVPYLETNRFRPRVRAIQKTRPITYRAKVLEQALLAVRTDANSFWMLLSGNAEVAFLFRRVPQWSRRLRTSLRLLMLLLPPQMSLRLLLVKSGKHVRNPAYQ